MEIIDKNLPDKPDSKPSQKPTIHAGGLESGHDSSFFHGRSTISKTSLRQDLNRPKILNELKHDLGLANTKEAKGVAEGIKSKIEKVHMSYINKPVAKRIIDENRLDQKKEVIEKMKGGFTSQETREISRGKKLTDFLKKKFGIK